MRDYEFYYTQDGSIGLYSHDDNDVYHSKYGAVTEAWEKFIIPSGLAKKLNNSPNIKVLDVCYGIGYNTKALMSYVINHNEKFLYRKSILKKIFEKIINFLKKIKIKLKKILFEKFSKIISFNKNNVSIDNNNIGLENNEILSAHIETINTDNTTVGYKLDSPDENINNYNDNLKYSNDDVELSKIKIDCLEINKELVKISPLLKTVITPQEVFSRIVPKIFDCFDTYWTIKRFLSKIAFKFLPKNKRQIKELLDLRFNNDYDVIDNEYRIHKFVNYILVDKLSEQYKDRYFDEELKNIIKDKAKKKFFEPSLVAYAKFKQNSRYNLLSKTDLLSFLHNIYYDHLSNRYKKAHFKTADKLFEVNFHVDDARKSILNINEQYDLIFLDAFTFSKAPELWTVEFMAELYRRLSPTGMLMTYSNSALVRNTFLENNFYIGKILCNKTGKCIGTIATKEKNLIEHPLSNYEMGLCSTRAGIPYHDPALNYTKEQILKHREIEFKNSDLMTSSQYMRARTSAKGETLDE